MNWKKTFGTLDLPPGGKLPPAPTYQTVTGEEMQWQWAVLGWVGPQADVYIPVPPYHSASESL